MNMLLFSAILPLSLALIHLTNTNISFDITKQERKELYRQLAFHMHGLPDPFEDADLSAATKDERDVLVNVLGFSKYAYPLTLLNQLKDEEIAKLPLEKLLPNFPRSRVEALEPVFGIKRPLSEDERIFMNEIYNCLRISDAQRAQAFYQLATNLMGWPLQINNGHVPKGPLHRFVVFGRAIPEISQLNKQMEDELKQPNLNQETYQLIMKKYAELHRERLRSIFEGVLSILHFFQPQSKVPAKPESAFQRMFRQFLQKLPSYQLNPKGRVLKAQLERAFLSANDFTKEKIIPILKAFLQELKVLDKKMNPQMAKAIFTGMVLLGMAMASIGRI